MKNLANKIDWLEPQPELNLVPVPRGFSVRFRTQICDADGNVIREGQSGHNEITDWGMDALYTSIVGNLMSTLHLSSAIGPVNRIGTGTGTTLSLSVTSATSITVTSSAGFFLAGDAGNTLSINGLQELKITAYSSSTVVTCSTRQGFWLTGSAPASGPYSSFGVHFTSTITLNTQFTKFATYDTTASNYNAVGSGSINDSGNSRFINQNIFLSAVVSGSAWTVNQLGWSDGNASNYVLGKVNLASPDVIAIGQRYRVQLQVFEGYTPLDIASQSVNWGATIGTYTLQMRTENIFGDGSDLLSPHCLFNRASSGYRNSTHSMSATKWRGDAGAPYNVGGSSGFSGSTDLSDASYVGGSHTVARTWKIPDTWSFSGAYYVYIYNPGEGAPIFSIVPTSGTIAKPAGYWAALTFNICWTRQLTN